MGVGGGEHANAFEGMLGLGGAEGMAGGNLLGRVRDLMMNEGGNGGGGGDEEDQIDGDELEQLQRQLEQFFRGQAQGGGEEEGGGEAALLGQGRGREGVLGALAALAGGAPLPVPDARGGEEEREEGSLVDAGGGGGAGAGDLLLELELERRRGLLQLQGQGLEDHRIPGGGFPVDPDAPLLQQFLQTLLPWFNNNNNGR